MIHILYKEKGETPLQCIEKYKSTLGVAFGTKATYAGRLDPLAEGLMPVLTDKDIENKAEFQSLSKTYTCTALIGVATDTYDILGLPTKISKVMPNDEDIRNALSSMKGTFEIPYPPYSSKTVDGKALHEWEREGRLEEVEIPLRSMTIRNIEVNHVYALRNFEIMKEVDFITNAVTGDFRQQEIHSAWTEVLNNLDVLKIVEFTCEVDSGTYIRSIVHLIGSASGSGACVLRLKRDSVGKYTTHSLPRIEIQSMKFLQFAS